MRDKWLSAQIQDVVMQYCMLGGKHNIKKNINKPFKNQSMCDIM